eukprot:m.4778 g.4778  ORF g.4778 m.4778 type:complete len:284 (-) comp5171_c0_seq1:52-903(-)
MFSFGFSKEDKPADPEPTKPTPEQPRRQAVSITLPELKTNDILHVNEIKFKNGTTIPTIDVAQIELSFRESSKQNEQEDLETNPIAQSVTQKSDLIPGVYEGGLKVWECSIDLVEVLMTKSAELAKLRVLELGCGAGLPGLYALLQGASVVFQDYNEEVVRSVTIPNARLNVDTEGMKRCKFFAGDWSLLKDPLSTEGQFDLILTAETIYHDKTQETLIDLMQHCLKPTGSILLAAKSHYFGVGGGLLSFKKRLKEHGYFSETTVWRHSEGVCREVLELRLKE